jgi:hypothetical protein
MQQISIAALVEQNTQSIWNEVKKNSRDDKNIQQLPMLYLATLIIT